MKALLVVDMQRDFCEGGAFAIPGADEIIPIINDLLKEFDLVVFTRDFHPHDHKSFASQHEGKSPFDVIDLNGLQQVLWPDHCVQGTLGSELHPRIDLTACKKDFYFIKKGMDREVDSYSAFVDNGQKNPTGLMDFLDEKGVDKVFVCGLGNCAKYTALDSKILGGYETYFIENAARFIGEKETFLNELQEANIPVIQRWMTGLIL